MNRLLTMSVALIAITPLAAQAEVTICASLSVTGPAASLGIPEQQTVAFLPQDAGGKPIRYVVFDDATDPTKANTNARKCVEDEKADILLGSSTAPTSASVAAVAGETGTPVIALAPVTVDAAIEPWVYRSVQKNALMASALLEHMAKTGVKRLGFIGFADAFGEDWLKTVTPMLESAGIELVAVERFARTDTSVTGQVLKLAASAPDAVLVAGSGTPSALPAVALRERGFAGQIYQTHGSATTEYIRVGGASVEGSILPVGPVVVAPQLPDSHPSRSIGVEYYNAYVAAYGEGSVSAFGGMMFDAGQLAAAAIAAAEGIPGTPEYRMALRDALEGLTDVVSVNGVYNMSAEDHYGHDQRSRVLVQVTDGAFKYLHLD